MARVYIDLGVFLIERSGVRVGETFGASLDDRRSITGIPLR